MGKKSREKKERRDKAQVPSSPENPVRAEVWVLFLICLVAFLAYVRTLSFDFVYDDEYQVLRNPWIHDWSKVGKFFTTDVWAFARSGVTANYYRPFHMIAHAVGYSLSGLRPEGYHLINIMLHVFSTLLVAWIALRLTKNKSVAILGSLIFALHPIHTESVTWIAAVPDPLCAVFYLGALYLYIGDIEGRRSPWAIAGYLILFLCAMFSKEMAASFLVVALWADWCLLRKLRWNRYALILGIFGIYLMLRISALGEFIPKSRSFSMSYLDQALGALVLLASYVVKLFVPFGIKPFHFFHPVSSILDVRLFGSIAALAIFAFLAWWQRKNRPALFLFGFALLSLIPLMSISRGGGEFIFADRYLYLPSMASCLLIPILVQNVWKLRPAAIPSLGKYAAYVFISPLLLVFGGMTIYLSSMWRDSPTLYTESLKREPDSITAANHLAQYYFNKKDYKRAEPLFRRVIELIKSMKDPNTRSLSSAYIGLGGIQFYQNHMDRAKEYFEEAYKLTPNAQAVLTNLGSIYMSLGDYAAATRFLESSLQANPRNEVIYNNLAVMYLELGQYEKALSSSQKAVQIFPRFGRAYIAMAKAYAALGMVDKASEAYKTAMEVDPIQKPLAEEGLKELEASSRK